MFAQLFIALFGVTAVALTQSTLHERRKWASIFGLIGQPFWFYAAYTTQQWGIFALCFLYTASWAKGFYNFWIAPSTEQKPYRFAVVEVICHVNNVVNTKVLERYTDLKTAETQLEILQRDSSNSEQLSYWRRLFILELPV